MVVFRRLARRGKENAEAQLPPRPPGKERNVLAEAKRGSETQAAAPVLHQPDARSSTSGSSVEAYVANHQLDSRLESALLEAATLEASANGTMHSPIGGKTPSMSVVAARQAAEGTATHSTASESDSGAGTAQAPAQKGVSNAMAGDDTLARELDIGILRAELAAARCEIRSLEVRVRIQGLHQRL